MCGITGVVSRERDAEFATLTERMTAAVSHRGPDSHGVQDFGSCVLGNTRLAIVDLSERGHMPMCNEDSTVWITYNGECYNAAELRPSLIALGHQFRSTTDTEVIVHLYEQYGDSCVERLRGMFAFAIWDLRRRKLLLARDRLGIKPLYYNYADEHGRLLFASEIKALLASRVVPRKIDPCGIRAFLQLGHVPPPWTAIQGVKPLEAGYVGVWQDGSFKTSPYWKLPASKNGHHTERSDQIVGSLRDRLLESSREQLMSDVPVALFLSGGIDSAVLGALVKQVGAGSMTALTIGFEEESFDESQQAGQTAHLLGIPHRTIRLPASRMVKSLDHALWAMDQPTVDGLNAYWISKAAAEAGFKVALSGQGGDELFGGYSSHEWFERFSHVASWLKPVPHVAGSGLLNHKSFPFRWRKLSYLVGADDPFVAAQLAVRVQFLEEDVSELLNPSLKAPDPVSEATECIREWARQITSEDLMERIAFVDFPAHLEARLLRDGDAMSMAHSLEVRPVMLDHTLVEYVLSLPSSIRLQKKRLLLDATRECMPGSLHFDLRTRPKRTFTFPFSRWIGEDLRATIQETFSPDRLAAVGVLNPEAVRKLWARYLENPAAVGWSRLWTIFVLARWCEIMQAAV
jgi:asparagine synthase (glutamine-hydrolysing)